MILPLENSSDTKMADMGHLQWLQKVPVSNVRVLRIFQQIVYSIIFSWKEFRHSNGIITQELKYFKLSFSRETSNVEKTLFNMSKLEIS